MSTDRTGRFPGKDALLRSMRREGRRGRNHGMEAVLMSESKGRISGIRRGGKNVRGGSLARVLLINSAQMQLDGQRSSQFDIMDL
ncbi:hypothetical protein CEXT_671491 [Caerostris extrusa]|uniref:Uncharacterized protein n=1 Tax=Caerostris extrusa TaxID=172846 RepID=A0AAV4RVV6_CAEEX|nr:hypothetical protein CEXT_671491 [Caerostris extrusa]